jgi:hypothetical protein
LDRHPGDGHHYSHTKQDGEERERRELTDKSQAKRHSGKYETEPCDDLHEVIPPKEGKEYETGGRDIGRDERGMSEHIRLEGIQEKRKDRSSSTKELSCPEEDSATQEQRQR